MATKALLPHPELWWTALRQARVFVPASAWSEFRLHTAFGDSEPTGADIVGFMRWCRNWRFACRRR
jgi:hypothetical protein